MAPITLVPTARNRRLIGYPLIALALALAFLGGIIGVVVAVGLIAGYVALYIKLGAARIILDDAGVTRIGMTGTKKIRWDEVKRYRFISIDPTQNMHASGQGGLVAVLVIAAVKAVQAKGNNRKFKAGRLALHGEAGHAVVITTAFKGAEEALDFAFAQLHPRLAGGTSFGDLSFDGNTLRHHKKGELSIAELDSVVIAPSGIVTIRKVGKRLGWASTTMARLDNPVLLFERLVDRSVRLDMADGVFLPHPTIALLADAATARANLPKAVVVSK